MKVYACPTECAAPEPDYRNYDFEKEQKAEEGHQKALRAYLIKQGYNGKHTGKIVRFGVADGYAAYMLADGRKSFLIHLPYGDAYQYRDVQFLPKAEILRRIAASERLDALFSKKG